MRYAHAVYCDDIRHEAGNKTSMMGIYNGQLGVEEFPCAIAKLCLSISISTPKDELFSSLSLIGEYSGVEMFKMEMDKSQIDTVLGQTPKLQSEAKFYMVQLVAILSPLQIEKAGKISVTVLADGEKLECAGLEIISAPSSNLL